MRGVYTFKQRGKVVGVSKNLITTAGKKAIIDLVAGYTPRLAGSIALGIGNAAATVADKSLQFQIVKIPVTLSSADYINGSVVFKGSVRVGHEMTIYESGVYTGEANFGEFDSQTLLDFNASTDVWSTGSFLAANSRLGSFLNVTAAASTTTTSSLTGIYFDLSRFLDADQFLLAYRASNAFVASFSVRLKTDASNYYTFTVNAPATGVYTIAAFNKSAAVATGTPSWDNITSVDIVTTSTAGGTGGIALDGLRIESRAASQEDNILVSRSVLGAPVVKTFDVPLDVEYAITL